jgi:hypothetical protein
MLYRKSFQPAASLFDFKCQWRVRAMFSWQPPRSVSGQNNGRQRLHLLMRDARDQSLDDDGKLLCQDIPEQNAKTAGSKL